MLPFENLTGAPDQQYLSDGLTEEMIAQMGRLHPQRLTVLAHPDGTVSLRAHTGFLCAEGGGGGCAICNRPWAKEWEKWSVVKGRDGTVTLKSSGGSFLRADDGGVSASGDATQFTIEFVDGYVYLKTPSGKYVSAQP